MSVYLSAGVFPSELDFTEYVKSLNTSNVGMVAITDRGLEGSVGANTPITSWDDFKVKCGGFRSDSYGAYAAQMFFDNGGGRLFLSRVFHNGVDGTPLTAVRSKITVKSDEATPVDLFDIEALSFGKWGDNLRVNITPNTKVYADGFDIEVQLVEGTKTNTKERFQHLTLTEANPDFAVAKVQSGYIRLVDKVTDSTGKTVKSQPYVPVGGNDGLTGIADADYVTAIKAFGNASISTLFIPGVTSATVMREAILFCEARTDVFPIFETPQGSTVTGATTFRDGAGNPFNSSYGALYHPWLVIKDPRNGLKKPVPPTGAVAGIFNRGNIWEAPAGVNRGIVKKVDSVETILDQPDRDTLYEAGINPIAQFLDSGAVVWGQKTLLLKPSALDRINVRRLMNFLEKSITVSAKSIVFESDNKSTWNALARRVVPFLQGLKDDGGLTDFLFICDDTTNTPEIIDLNQILAKIFVKPTRSAEFIGVEFILTPTGAKFTEFLAA